MEDIKKKLNEYAEIPANVDLENTMRERNGVPIILCVPLDEAILICEEAIKDAKEEGFQAGCDFTCKQYGDSNKKITELIDEVIVDETLYGWNHSAKVLNELKQRIEAL